MEARTYLYVTSVSEQSAEKHRLTTEKNEVSKQFRLFHKMLQITFVGERVRVF